MCSEFGPVEKKKYDCGVGGVTMHVAMENNKGGDCSLGL